MIFGQAGDSDQLGFSLNPIKAVKSVAHGVKKGVVATGHGIATGAKATEHGAVTAGKFVKKNAVNIALLTAAPVLLLTKLVGEPALKLALRPIQAKVNTLKDRRAKKLAWDRRKSRTPNAAEKAEAKAWAKSTLRTQKPPFGLTMSLLAGPPAVTMHGLGDFDQNLCAPQTGQFGDPATVSVIIASIPVMLAIINALLNSKSNSGEAPATIRADGTPSSNTSPQEQAQAQATAQAAVQDATAAAENAIARGDGSDGSGGYGPASGGQMVQLPGGTSVKKSHLLIGGIVVGGLVLVALLTKKS